MLGIIIGRDGMYQVWSGGVWLVDGAAQAVKFLQTSVWTSDKADKMFQTHSHRFCSLHNERNVKTKGSNWR